MKQMLLINSGHMRKHFSSINKKLSIILLLLFLFQFMNAQNKITGVVTDENKATLTGVNVIIQGTTSGTVTDSEGKYSITVPNSEAVLMFSFVGYQTELIPVGTNTAINVTLMQNSEFLDEVVVIGYGTARKKDLTGSVSTLNEKEFQKGPVISAEQLIANKMPGVQIIPSSGSPGSENAIIIRGGASLNASNDPLIVIDGVPVEGMSRLSLLNPKDIEVITVLKDASATAIYGSRASNGVILVNTKKGRNEKLGFSYSTRGALSQVVDYVPVLTGNQFRLLVKDAAQYSGVPIATFNLGTANTDWQKEIYQLAFGIDNNFSITGGLKSLPYRLSFGYLNQDGVLKTENYERLTTNLNLNPSFFDNHLNLNVNLKLSNDNKRYGDSRAIYSAISFDPTQPVYDENSIYGGYFEYTSLEDNPANLHGHYNPVGMLNQIEDYYSKISSVGNIQLDYKIHFLPDLHFNLNSGYELLKGNSRYSMPATAFENNISNGSVYTADPSDETMNTFFETYFKYKKDLASIKSAVDLMAGFSYHDFLSTYYYYPSYNVYGDVQPNSEPTFPFDKPRHKLMSYYTRLNYILMDRYVLTATVRRDGSSRFSNENRWGIFPSIAFAWKINEESFLKNSQVISDLKLRLGYGTTGQQDGIGNYDYIPLYTLGSMSSLYPIGSGYYQRVEPSATDRNRKWEQTTTSNLGIDWGVYSNRITGSVDLYYKETTDLLNTVNIPAGTDFATSITKNIGSMVNKGIELSINAKAIESGDFSWNLLANFTYNENQIVSLSDVDDDEIGLFAGSYLVNTIGYSRNTFYLYHQLYSPDGTPLEDAMLDVNKDGQINEKDRYRSKSSIPKYMIGFSTDFRYKKFTLSIAMHSNLGHYMYYRPSDNMVAMYGWIVPHNLSTAYYETEFRMTGNQHQEYSDYYLQNASFLKMDNINVNYNLGKIFKSFNSDANLNIGASVQNVFTLTNYQGANPEASWNWGVDTGGSYPIPRIYSFSLNLDF